MRAPGFWPILSMGATFGYGNYFFVAWLHTYLLRARDYSEGDLLLTALPFACGACANLASGVMSDRLLKRFGLKAARRWLGQAGLGSGALFVLLATLTDSKSLTLLLLSLSFAGISCCQSIGFPTCIDVARKWPGSMSGAYNMAVSLGAFVSGVAFGYIVAVSGNYDLPLILMALVLGSGALLWLKIDPTRQLLAQG